MKPPRFEYVRIESAEQACAMLAQHGEDARVLAGGQSLLPILNMRLAQPRWLLDISRTRTLDYARIDGGRLCIGAAATQASIEWREHLASEVPVLALAFPHISHFQIRNRGTVCGSIAHADPSAELALCLALLKGEVVLCSQRGKRVLTADEFFQGMLQTARRPDELVEEVRYPLSDGQTGYAFEEFSMRHGDFAIVACTAAVNQHGIRLAVGGVADRPCVAAWPCLEGDALEQALNDFAWDLEARDDPHASGAYRRHLVRRIGQRVIERARHASAQRGTRKP